MQKPSDAELRMLVAQAVADKMNNEESFSKHDVTKLVRLQNPTLNIEHERVRELVPQFVDLGTYVVSNNGVYDTYQFTGNYSSDEDAEDDYDDDEDYYDEYDNEDEDEDEDYEGAYDEYNDGLWEVNDALHAAALRHKEKALQDAIDEHVNQEWNQTIADATEEDDATDNPDIPCLDLKGKGVTIYDVGNHYDNVFLPQIADDDSFIMFHRASVVLPLCMSFEYSHGSYPGQTRYIQIVAQDDNHVCGQLLEQDPAIESCDGGYRKFLIERMSNPKMLVKL